MGPVESLIKNAILVVLIGAAWAGGLRAPAPAESKKNYARPIAAAGMGLVLALASYDLVTSEPVARTVANPAAEDPDRPFAQFMFEADGQSFDLGRGEYLVPLLNATCDHCRASVPALNEMFVAGDMPEMVALMMGDQREIEEFRTVTEPLFALHRIDTLTFMEFIGTSPPRLIYVKDGVDASHWDWTDDVPVAEIQSFVETGGD